ncbi:MAG: hypothetical protein IH924_02100 [Proteobacteria bacterium]|nr:hypothetical protein [Pseudomonadota bacterium]
MHSLVKGPGGEPPPARPPCRAGRPGKKRPAPAPKPKIDLDRLDLDRLDLDRLVWDPEYRDEIRRRLNRRA